MQNKQFSPSHSGGMSSFSVQLPVQRQICIIFIMYLMETLTMNKRLHRILMINKFIRFIRHDETQLDILVS